MKLAILGPGRIARTVAPTLAAIPEIECYAAASRTPGRAEDFAREFGFEKAYDSYEAMLQDPAVELVYITTPHSHHYEQICQCLEHGKHVICEKAFTMNADQARKVRELSVQKGLYVAEAIWTRYMPSRQLIDEIIKSGIIGAVNTLTANLSYNIAYKSRIMEPALAGGALLDIGIYGLNFALMHFGDDIERIESSVKLTDTGVDAMETITILYKNGRMAVLTHSIYCRSDRRVSSMERTAILWWKISTIPSPCLFMIPATICFSITKYRARSAVMNMNSRKQSAASGKARQNLIPCPWSGPSRLWKSWIPSAGPGALCIPRNSNKRTAC